LVLHRQKCAYLFDKDMQKNEVDHVISDMCMFLRREIFNAQGRFFDKNVALAEFPQLCNYERFGLWTVIFIDILRNNMNIDDRCCEYCCEQTIWLLNFSCCVCEMWILVMLCEYSCECLVYILLWILNLKIYRFHIEFK
jgi:hypothetical protein